MNFDFAPISQQTLHRKILLFDKHLMVASEITKKYIKNKNELYEKHNLYQKTDYQLSKNIRL